LHPESTGSEECTLDAMCSALPNNFTHGKYRFSSNFVIRWNAIQKSLNLLWRAELFEKGKLPQRKTQILTFDARVH
jgi:hypothetical protein